MNILIIAPHADDEILGCGGIMSKRAAENSNVFVSIMTNAHLGAPELFSEYAIKSIREEALEAHKLLHVRETFFYDFPAPRLETTACYEISNALNSLFKKLSIDTIYLPHRGDIHMDHRVIFSAGLVAARPINNCTVKNIFAYETLSETEWAAPFSSEVFIPNVFEDVSDHISTKVEAMKCFKSQLKEFPHSRSIEGIRSLANTRGATVGCPSAEAFALIRSIK